MKSYVKQKNVDICVQVQTNHYYQQCISTRKETFWGWWENWKKSLRHMLKIIASNLNYHNFFDSLWWCPFGGAGTVWKCIFLLLLQVNSRSSKEEILHLLAKKGDQVSKLEAKIAGEQIFKNSFKWTHPVCRFIKYYTCSWSVWSG